MKDSEEEDQSRTQEVEYRECTQWPMKKGCKGTNVQTLQRLLNTVHHAGLKEDGFFGDNTERVLVANGYGSTVEAEDIQKMRELLHQQ